MAWVYDRRRDARRSASVIAAGVHPFSSGAAALAARRIHAESPGFFSGARLGNPAGHLRLLGLLHGLLSGRRSEGTRAKPFRAPCCGRSRSWRCCIWHELSVLGSDSGAAMGTRGRQSSPWFRSADGADLWRNDWRRCLPAGDVDGVCLSLFAAAGVFARCRMPLR